jgi:lysophospholipase L1-like esterase
MTSAEPTKSSDEKPEAPPVAVAEAPDSSDSSKKNEPDAEASSDSEGEDEEEEKKQSPLQRVVSLVVGLVVALLVGEVAVRIMASQSLIYNIEMVRYAKELKMPDPRGEVSHVHRPNSQAHLMGVDLSLNALGHRGPDLPPKSPDRKRVYVLGSSVTMGWGIPFDQMFTSVVETKFNKDLPLGPATHVEFANAGIGNYNTFAQSRLFAHQYSDLKPDLVVLHYFISDPEPRPPGKNSAILRHSMFAAYCYDRFRTLGLAAEGKNDLAKHYSDIYDDKQPYWNDTLTKIAEMRDAAAKDNVPFLVMIIPDFHNLKPGTPYGELYDKMDKGFAAKGIRAINTFPEFQKKYGGNESALWIQPDDPHPNAVGHALMAELLYQELAKPGAFELAKQP